TAIPGQAAEQRHPSPGSPARSVQGDESRTVHPQLRPWGWPWPQLWLRSAANRAPTRHPLRLKRILAMSNPYTNTRIEFHILQSFPVTCLNRDDVGAPKTAVVGGVNRARVSSQCWKRQVRLAMQEFGI